MLIKGSNLTQQYAGIYLLQSHSTCFGPSSGALKTVTATSGIGHNTGTATSFQRGLLRTVLSRPRWKEVAGTSIMTCTRGSGYSF